MNYPVLTENCLQCVIGRASGIPKVRRNGVPHSLSTQWGFDLSLVFCVNAVQELGESGKAGLFPRHTRTPIFLWPSSIGCARTWSPWFCLSLQKGIGGQSKSPSRHPSVGVYASSLPLPEVSITGNSYREDPSHTWAHTGHLQQTPGSAVARFSTSFAAGLQLTLAMQMKNWPTKKFLPQTTLREHWSSEARMFPAHQTRVSLEYTPLSVLACHQLSWDTGFYRNMALAVCVHGRVLWVVFSSLWWPKYQCFSFPSGFALRNCHRLTIVG